MKVLGRGSTRKGKEQERSRLPAGWPSNTPQAFRPLRSFKEGSQCYNLTAKLYSSPSFEIEDIRRPDGVPQTRWVKVNTVEFYNQLSMMFGAIDNSCECASMTCGPEYEFVWAEEEYKGRPKAMPALEYITRLFDWAQKLVENESVFPSDDKEPGKGFHEACSKLFRRLCRVLMHIYHHHQDYVNQNERTFKNVTRHLVMFSLEFRLTSPSNFSPIFSYLQSILPETYKQKLGTKTLASKVAESKAKLPNWLHQPRPIMSGTSTMASGLSPTTIVKNPERSNSGPPSIPTPLLRAFRQVGLTEEEARNYAALLAENDIDETLFGELDEKILQSIGVQSVGHRMKLLQAKSYLSGGRRTVGSPLVLRKRSGEKPPEIDREIDTLADLLESLQLSYLIETFEDEEVDLEALKHFTQDELVELGIKRGPAKKILSALQAKSTSTPTTPTTPTSARPTSPLVPQETVKIGAVSKITEDDLTFLHVLGRGAFGEVYKGRWRRTTNVAIKKLYSHMMQEGESEIIKEAEILRDTPRHPNVVAYYGSCVSKTYGLCLVMEYVAQGSLFNYVRDNSLTTKQLINLARGIASGMDHLVHSGIVHRDLALRNVLVEIHSRTIIPKISDFGLARQTDDTYWSTTGKVAVKWAAPEALRERRFSTKSDVWSFGVLLWELFTGGSVPYTPMGNLEAVQKVLNGERLERPPKCPEVIYGEVMIPCWMDRPEDRPTFAEIFDKLKKLGSGRFDQQQQQQHHHSSDTESSDDEDVSFDGGKTSGDMSTIENEGERKKSMDDMPDIQGTYVIMAADAKSPRPTAQPSAPYDQFLPDLQQESMKFDKMMKQMKAKEPKEPKKKPRKASLPDAVGIKTKKKKTKKDKKKKTKTKLESPLMHSAEAELVRRRRSSKDDGKTAAAEGKRRGSKDEGDDGSPRSGGGSPEFSGKRKAVSKDQHQHGRIGDEDNDKHGNHNKRRGSDQEVEETFENKTKAKVERWRDSKDADKIITRNLSAEVNLVRRKPSRDDVIIGQPTSALATTNAINANAGGQRRSSKDEGKAAAAEGKRRGSKEASSTSSPSSPSSPSEQGIEAMTSEYVLDGSSFKRAG